GRAPSAQGTAGSARAAEWSDASARRVLRRAAVDKRESLCVLCAPPWSVCLDCVPKDVLIGRMLSGSRILVTTADGEVAPFTPYAPIRSSAGLGWQGIHLEEPVTPPMALMASAPQEDLIWLQLSPLVERELRHNGDWQALRTAAGTVGIRPRGVVHDGRWHNEVRSVVVALSTALLDNAAESLGVR